MSHQYSQLIALTLICCLGQFGIDIVSPSLPAISAFYHISINTAQWSMVIYLLSFSLSPAFYGPLADKLGRKKPLLCGLLLMLMGSIICTVASTIIILIVGRLLQGLGAGACVLWRTIFRDCFSGDELAKMGSYLGSLIMFIVPAAPLLGGVFQTHWGWHASFAFMAIYGMASLIITFFILDETQDKTKNSALPVINTYLEIGKHPTFLFYVFTVCMTFGAFYAWFVVGPILWINQLHHSSLSFGQITFITSASMMFAASIVNGRLVTRWGQACMLRIGWTVMIMSGVALMISPILFGFNAYTLFIPIAILYFGSTLIYPNINASAFTPFGHIAGYATAVYALGQSFGGFMLGAIMAHTPDNTVLPLGCTIIVAATLAWIVYEWRCKNYV